MYTLQFEPQSRGFDIMYQSLLASPVPLRGATERRLHGDMLTKLEAIAQPKIVRDAQNMPREYLRDEQVLFETVGGGSVTFTNAEFELLRTHTRATVEADFFPKVLSRQGQQVLDDLAVTTPDPLARPATDAEGC